VLAAIESVENVNRIVGVDSAALCFAKVRHIFFLCTLDTHFYVLRSVFVKRYICMLTLLCSTLSWS
jgi:hypothetical protein